MIGHSAPEDIHQRQDAMPAEDVNSPSSRISSPAPRPRPPRTPDHAAGEARLAEFLAPGVVPEDLPDLHPLLAARGTLSALSALFHGGEDAVLVRLLVLREIGARADAPAWSPAELEARFSYLDATKLNTVLARLREHELLQWDLERRLYALSANGRMVLSALALLLDFAAHQDAELGYLTAQVAAGGAVGRISKEALRHLLARLAELEGDFASALQSQSEARLLRARERLDSVYAWVERGTEVMRTLSESGQLDDAGWRLAQEIGSRQSRILRLTGVFQRELAQFSRQRVRLSEGGLTSSELAAWLRKQPADVLAALAAGAVAVVPEPVFIAADVMVDVAEYELLERERAAQDALTLPPPAPIAETTDATAEPPPELAPLLALLCDLPAGTPAENVVVGGSWAAAAYRFSLLALLGEPTEGDPLLAPLAQSPLRLQVAEAEPVPVDRDEIARITPATLEHGDD
jgi:hypothetical protein